MSSKAIDRSLISSLSDAQIYHLDRIRQINDETSNEVNYINEQIKGSIHDSLATVKAARASLDESILSQIRKDIDVQNYELENIRKAMEKQIYEDIQKQWLNLQEAGLPLQLSDVEQTYYDAYSPAQAFYLTNIDKFDPSDIDRINALLAVSASIDDENNVAIDPNTELNPEPIEDIIEVPIVPPTPNDDEKICYTYLTGANGKITSIPVAINRNRSCEELGMHSTPYVEPVSPPTVPPANNGVTISQNDMYWITGDTKWKYHSKDVLNCQDIGGSVRISTFTDGKQYPACYLYDSPAVTVNPFPPDTLPTSSGNSVECGVPTTIWDYLSKSQEAKTKVETPCPPGCISIDSLKASKIGFSSECGTWDNMSTVCTRPTVSTSVNSDIAQVTQLEEGQWTNFAIDLVNSVWDLTPSGVLLNYIMGNDSAVSDVVPTISNVITEGIEWMFKKGVQSINSIVEKHISKCVGDTKQIINSLMVQSASGWASTFSMSDVSYHFTSYVYEGKFANPQLLPSQADFDGMYLADEITDEQWECYTKALGNLPNTHRSSRNVKRSRVGPREYIMLNRYGKIPENDYKDLMRSVGVINDGDRKDFEDSQVSLPGLPDILRFMVRDADNETVVEKYKLDEGFTDSYKDKLKLWAKTQGVEEETAKYFWRSHWEYPSPTALYEMLKRLRPGTVPKEIEVTKQDALDLLKIADIAPYWREKLLAVSYNVPTRTDVKKGFNIDAIPEDKLVDMLQDNGYTEDDAKVIKDIYVSEKEIYKQNLYSRWSAFTPKSIAKMYGEGSLTREEANEQLTRMNFKPEAIIAILLSGQLSQKQRARKQCIDGNKRLYMIGQLEDNQVVNSLVGQGVDRENAEVLYKEWQCKKLSSSKVVPTGKNLKWYTLGIINAEDLRKRLENLLYDTVDVNRLMQEAEYSRNAYIRNQYRKALNEARGDIKFQDWMENKTDEEIAAYMQQLPQSKANP